MLSADVARRVRELGLWSSYVTLVAVEPLSEFVVRTVTAVESPSGWWHLVTDTDLEQMADGISPDRDVEVLASHLQVDLSTPGDPAGTEPRWGMRWAPGP